MTTVFTVGHSNHPIGALVALLHQHGVTALGDVRSSPYSRRCPWFSRDALRHALQGAGIGYGFLGKELGARRDEREVYVDGRADYGRIAELPLFKEGIVKLLRGAERQRVAIMCSEHDPLECHRTILVGRALIAEGATLAHIRRDGRIETQPAAEDRLLAEEGQGGGLFAATDRAGALACAYNQRGEKIAYRNP